MYRKSSISLIVLWLSLYAISSYAIATPLPSTTYFKVTDMTSGLPDNSVNDITEDPYGFIWVATWNGLARFDGKTVKTFAENGSEHSLSNNMVRCLLAEKDGIWVGTDVGLDFMRFSDNHFIHAKIANDSKSEI